MPESLSGMYQRGKWSLLLRGLIGIAVGVLIIMRPMDSVAVLALVIALWAIVDGVTNIVYAVELRSVAPHWGTWLFSGIISTIFGIAAVYYYPGLSLSFAVVWVGLWLALTGAMGIFIAIQERRANVPWGWTMALGIITLAAGVLAFGYPGITLAGLISVIASFAILGGIVRLIAAWKLQSFEKSVEGMMHRPARA